MALTTNKNFFNPIQAELTIRRLPNVNFFCQKVNIPGVSSTPPGHPNPFTTIRFAGDHLNFEEFIVTFKVDEYMTNYLEVMEWMYRLSFPESFEQYRKLNTSSWTQDAGPHSDGTVIFLDSKSNPKLELEIMSLFPISLSNIEVDTTLTDVEYLTATATFAYTLYNIRRLDGTVPDL